MFLAVIAISKIFPGGAHDDDDLPCLFNLCPGRYENITF